MPDSDNAQRDRSKESRTYHISMSEEQAETVVQALELFWRLRIGQLSELRTIASKVSSPLAVGRVVKELKQALFPEINDNAYYAMDFTRDLTTRRSHDIWSCLRYKIAWSKNPEGGWQTCYDPTHLTKTTAEPDPRVSVTEDIAL